MRDTTDSLNNGVGGALMGALVGASRGTVHAVFVGSVSVGVLAIGNAFFFKKFKNDVREHPERYPIF